MPYEQSRRTAFYEEAVQQLELSGHLYRCYCSRADLMSVANAPHGIASEGPAYPGTCRGMSEQERSRRERDKTPSWRYAMPDSRPIGYSDGVFGQLSFDSGAGGDFIVKRADGIFGYQLAVVVDDAAMDVTHVMRGEDLIDSTPRQLMLYESLGWTPPSFAHVPILIGPDGSRLSKRHGSISIHALRENGASPEQVVGFLAWLYGMLDRPEPANARSLIPLFSLSDLPREPIRLPESWPTLTGGFPRYGQRE